MTNKCVLLVDLNPSDVTNIIMNRELQKDLHINGECFYSYISSTDLNKDNKNIIKGIDIIVCKSYTNINLDVFTRVRAGDELSVYEVRSQEITSYPPQYKTVYNFLYIPREAYTMIKKYK